VVSHEGRLLAAARKAVLEAVVAIDRDMRLLAARRKPASG